MFGPDDKGMFNTLLTTLPFDNASTPVSELGRLFYRMPFCGRDGHEGAATEGALLFCDWDGFCCSLIIQFQQQSRWQL